MGRRPHFIPFKFLTVSNSFDHNKENRGKSFRGSTDDWEDSLMEDFGNLSAECFGKGVFQQV